jgi:tetratricopeptide (TPR) repeat protein
MGGAFFTVIGWAVGGLAFSFIFMQIINAWLIDKVISATHALLLMLVIIMLFGAVWTTQGQSAMYVYVALSLGAAGITHLLHVEHERRLLKRLREESMAKYRAVLARDPKNAAAHTYMAEALAEIGEYDDAIAEYQAAIALAPDASVREHHQLKMVEHAKARASGQAGIRCFECREESPRGSRTCTKCGASLNTSFFAWLFTPANLRDVLYRSAIPLLVAIIFIVILFRVSLPIAGCVIGATVLVGAFYLLRWFSQDS